MELPAPRPHAEQVAGIDVHLVDFSTVLRLAAGRFLAVHGEIIDQHVELFDELPTGSEGLMAAAQLVLSEFARHRDLLVADASKATRVLGERRTGEEDLALEVTIELCAALVTAELDF